MIVECATNSQACRHVPLRNDEVQAELYYGYVEYFARLSLVCV